MLHAALIGPSDYRRQNRGAVLMIPPYQSLKLPSAHEIRNDLTWVFRDSVDDISVFFAGKGREGEKILTVKPSFPALLHFFFLWLLFLFSCVWKKKNPYGLLLINFTKIVTSYAFNTRLKKKKKTLMIIIFKREKEKATKCALYLRCKSKIKKRLYNKYKNKKA